LPLNPDRSEDSNLKIRELPDITVRDYTQINRPIVIPNNDTAEEITKGSTFKEGDKSDMTTDSSSDTDACFDNSDNVTDRHMHITATVLDWL